MVNSSADHQPSSVAGGTGAEPTPANHGASHHGGNHEHHNGDSARWGDRLWMGGTNEGPGHTIAVTPRATMGEFLSLEEQKRRAEAKYGERVNLEETDRRPLHNEIEPSCATEDHSFMGKKAGDPDTLPGWETLKNIYSKITKDT